VVLFITGLIAASTKDNQFRVLQRHS